MNQEAPFEKHPDASTASRRSSRRRFLRQSLFGLGILLVIGVWYWREPLRREIRERATLSNDAPTPELVTEMIEQADDPIAALLAAWKSGKIVHRQVAIRSLPQVVPTAEPLAEKLNSLLMSAALDPDMNVRESALGIMQQRQHSALAALAAAQLSDPDQQVRFLGLNSMKQVPAKIGVPNVIPLLDDPDPLIITAALKRLENWSGENFGVKFSETGSFENETTGLKEFRNGSQEKARAGAARAKTWWKENRGSFPPVRLELPVAARAERLPAGDFRLPSLAGGSVRLSDFRGKVVLINFWTTWCTACVSEIPELIALQKKNEGDLVILGISLDYVPDSHGHIGGHAAVEDQASKGGDHDDREANKAAMRRVREKIARTVKARGINYPILLDEKNEVGGRFNGGELPTTVIIDADGNVRRRFIGARSLPVFEAMIAEARRPLAPKSMK